MKLTILIGFRHSWEEVKNVKKAVEELAEGIWATYTGYHHSKRTMLISAPSEELREKILELTKPIAHV